MLADFTGMKISPRRQIPALRGPLPKVSARVLALPSLPVQSWAYRCRRSVQGQLRSIPQHSHETLLHRFHHFLCSYHKFQSYGSPLIVRKKSLPRQTPFLCSVPSKQKTGRQSGAEKGFLRAVNGSRAPLHYFSAFIAR